MTSHDMRVEPDDEPAARLAAETLARLADGETVDLQAVAARLPDDATRRRFLLLVEDARAVQRLLPPALRPGTLLGGRYRLVREIGAGGMGRVFEAVDARLERRVAVKVLTSQGAANFDPERQFLNEALLLAGLQHPNIVAVHELGNHAGQPFLVMDLVEGTPLQEVLDRARAALRESGVPKPRDGALLLAAIDLPLPPGRRPPPAGQDWFRAGARVVLEVARTLESAHGRGIIHRDIKPHNVLLRGDATPVVLDFGLAGTLDRAGGGLTRGLFGTVAYLAPEQIDSGRIGTNARTDVYQLGLLLYELLVLQRAFGGDEISALLARIGRGEFLRPRAADPGVPAEIEAVCLRAMELDPARRYASMRELREDLQRWVEDGAPPLAARGGTLASGLRIARYAARRHRLALAVTGTAAAAALAFVLLQPAPPPAPVDLRPFREAGGIAEQAPDFTSVRPGDRLGITLRSREPRYLYALSIFGANGPREFAAPMVIDVVGRDDEASRSPDGWGTLVEPGEAVACTRIDEAAADGQYEGLLVFASTEKQTRLADWMSTLQLEAQLSGTGAVTWDRAREAFERKPGETRGGPVKLSAAEDAALVEALTSAAILGDASWELDDPRRWEFSFPVHR